MALRAISPKFSDALDLHDPHALNGGQRKHEPPPGSAQEVALNSRNGGHSTMAGEVALKGVFQEIVQQARLVNGATGAFIGLVRGHKIVCEAASGSTTSDFVAYLSRQQHMIDSCLRNGLQRCRDSEAYPELDASVCRYLGARSIVMTPVPILDQAELKQAIFGVFSPQPDAFSSANIVALQSLSARITEAAQVNRFASVSSPSIAVSSELESGLVPSPKPLGRALRPFAAAVTRPAGWALIVLAFVLLMGWSLGRNLILRPMHAAAKGPEVVAAKPASSVTSSERDAKTNTAQSPIVASVKPVTDLPAVQKNPSTDTNKDPGQGSATAPEVKSATNPAVVHKAQDKRKIPAHSQRSVPDLEIENALDDASADQPSSEPASSRESKTTEIRAAQSPSKEAGNQVNSTHAGPKSAFAVKVPEGTALDQLVERVKPVYPEDAKSEQVQGAVVFDVVVGKDGQVEGLSLVEGDARLVQAAAMALGRWRFTPLLRNGQPVGFESHITVNFALP